jgi:hypothetical protein
MTPRIRTLAWTLSLLAACAPASAVQAEARVQGYSRAAQKVLVQARTASGGAGWNFLRGWHETGHEGGLAYEAWLDPLRYGLRVEVHEAAGGVRAHGFNGQGAWQIAPGGVSSGGGEGPLVAAARTEAFFRVEGFLYSGRFDAAGRYIGLRNAKGRSFDVLEVKPWGGQARELWFDRKSHLLARMVDRSGPRPVTTEVSDYRRVGPVLVAFRYTPDSPEAAARTVEAITFVPADRALFSLPRPAEPPAP